MLGSGLGSKRAEQDISRFLTPLFSLSEKGGVNEHDIVSLIAQYASKKEDNDNQVHTTIYRHAKAINRDNAQEFLKTLRILNKAQKDYKLSPEAINTINELYLSIGEDIDHENYQACIESRFEVLREDGYEVNDFFIGLEARGNRYYQNKEYGLARWYYELILKHSNEKEQDSLLALSKLGDFYLAEEKFHEAAIYYNIWYNRVNSDPEKARRVLSKLQLVELLVVKSAIQDLSMQIVTSIHSNNVGRTVGLIKYFEELGDKFFKLKEGTYGFDIYSTIMDAIDTTGTEVPEIKEIRDRIFLKSGKEPGAAELDAALLQPREELRNIRSKVLITLYNEEEAGAYLNFALHTLIIGIIQDSISALQTEPCNYAVIGLGSIAKRYLSPYSDLDMMILTEKSVAGDAELKQYFKALIELIKIKIVNLGETRCQGKWSGVTFDTMGYFPSITEKEVRLIGTVDELWENDSTDVSALQDVVYLGGDKHLFTTYEAKSIDQEAIKRLIRHDLTLFELPKNLLNIIDVKQELLRFPTLYVSRLFMYHGLQDSLKSSLLNNSAANQKSLEDFVMVSKLSGAGDTYEYSAEPKECGANGQSSWGNSITHKKITLLVEAGHLTRSEGEGLKEWITFAQGLRIKVQLYYNIGKEVAYTDENLVGGYILEARDLELLCCMHEHVMAPIFQKVNRWLEGDNVTASINLASIYILKCKHGMEEYHKTENDLYAEYANWYFEEAVKLNLEYTERAWRASINALSDDENRRFTLELIDKQMQVQRLQLGAGIEAQLLDPSTKEIEGRRVVTKIYHRGEFYHIKELPFDPGIEYAVSSLSHLLFGYTTAPFSVLGKLTDGETGRVIPVLISRSVIGKKLNEELKRDSAALEKIDAESYGLMFTKTFLTNPGDGQSDNYTLQSTRNPYQRSEIKQRLFCIDNDQSFGKSKESTGFLWLQEKSVERSIVYFSRAADSKINAKVRAHLRILDPRKVVSWVTKLIEEDERNCALFQSPSASEVTKYWSEKHGQKEELPVHIRLIFNTSDIAANIYFKIIQLQNKLTETGEEYTYLNMSEEIRLLNKEGDTLRKQHRRLRTSAISSEEMYNELHQDGYEKRELEVGAKVQSVRVSRMPRAKSGHSASAISHSRSVPSTPYEVLLKLIPHVKSIELEAIRAVRNALITGEMYTGVIPSEHRMAIINGRVASANSIFIGNIFEAILNQNQYPEKIQRKVLSTITNNRILKDFTRLNLSSCIVLNDNYLYYVISREITWLDISRCPALGPEALNNITYYCTELETLYARNNSEIIFAKVTKVFPKLRTLIINNCKDLTDRSLLNLITKCPQLELLEFEGCDSVIASEHIKNNLERYKKAARNEIRFNINHEIANFCSEFRRLGIISYERGEYVKAIANYKSAMAVALKPGEVRDHNNLGLAYFANKEFAEAITSFYNAVMLKPDEARYHYYLGVAYHAHKEYIEAIASYNRAIALKLSGTHCYYYLGLAYCSNHQYEEAIKNFDEALALNPNCADYHYQLGLAYCSNHQYEEAIKSFNKAIVLKPNAGLYHNNLGCAHYSNKNYVKAIASYMNAIALEPDEAVYHDNLGLAYNNNNEYEKAIESFRAALALKPQDASYYYHLGLAHYSNNEYAEALKNFEDARGLAPSLPNPYRGTAILYFTQDRYEEALRDINQAIALAETSELYAWMSCSKGNILLKMKRYEEAFSNYLKALEIFPHDAMKKEVIEALNTIRDFQPPASMTLTLAAISEILGGAYKVTEPLENSNTHQQTVEINEVTVNSEVSKLLATIASGTYVTANPNLASTFSIDPALPEKSTKSIEAPIVIQTYWDHSVRQQQPQELERL